MEDIREVLEGLKKAPSILAEFVKSIPDEKMGVRRGEGFWTITEHLSHLAQVQPMLLDRFYRFMNEDRPEFVPYLPGNDDDEPDTPACLNTSDALEQFATHRNKQVVLLEGAGKIAWQKTAIHPEYEYYSLRILARHTLMHDYWHMYRMEELWLTRDAYLVPIQK
jgi:uncharacterized damage-inducible protein DinB